jgi:hypothetical protein
VKMANAVRGGSARCSFCKWSLSVVRTGASSSGDGGGSMFNVGGGTMAASEEVFGVIPLKKKKND